MKRRGSSLLALLAVLAAGASSLSAQEHPNVEHGFAADKAFHGGDIDNVNTFNGVLVLTIPLGQAYKVGGNLSYGLTLVYNSSPWLFQQRTDSNTLTYTQADPSPRSNAGLGWAVSLGHLYAPGAETNETTRWVYASPDGGSHQFYGTLHRVDTADTGGGFDLPVMYTRDGTYMRLLNAQTAPELDLPNGEVYRFDDQGRPTSMRDPFNNQVTIGYSASQWTITDSASGRTLSVSFRTDLPGYPQTVSTVDLEAVGRARAVYTFNYAPQTLARPYPWDDTLMQSSTVQVQLLTSVVLPLPDGSSYQYRMATTDYDLGTAPPGNARSGSILGLNLPTLGRLEWTYQMYAFPTNSAKYLHHQQAPGVATRTEKDATGTVLGTWSYTTSRTPGDQELVNSVTDPLGNRAVRYFSVYSNGTPLGGWDAHEYSLPLTHNAADATGQRFLSTQTFNSAGTLLRSTYVRYEWDGTNPASPASMEDLNFNRREVTNRTLYVDDGNRTADVNRSDFDNLGHYRRSDTDGTFGVANQHSSFTGFNLPSPVPRSLTPPVAAQGSAPIPAATSAWRLDDVQLQVEQETVVEGSATSEVDLCVDPTTGFVTRKRITATGTAPGAHDLLAVYTPSSSSPGDIGKEQYYGGDLQTLPTGSDPCAVALPATDQFGIVHGYQSGTLASSTYTTAAGGTWPFQSLDLTIDRSTGLPLASRDVAGLETKFEYDLLGRITWSEPGTGQGGWTQYQYTQATSALSLASANVFRRADGGKTAPVLAQTQYFFDALGRVWREQQKMADGSFQTRETLYNGNGWKASVSEMGGAFGQRTQYLSYDPFGRPGIVRPPDGSAHDVHFAYNGISTVIRTQNLATTVGSETSSTTTELTDRQGRLWQIIDSSGEGGANVTTAYRYDVGNRLVRVFSGPSVGGVVVNKNRHFAYDNLGFLRSETVPEKGAAGNGVVTYSNYTSRGQVGRKIDGTNDLTYSYDRAERLTQVQETGTGGRLLKTFTYAGSNGTNDWRLGKLQSSTRYNYPVLGGTPYNAFVNQSYVYGGRDGRVSQKTSSLTFNGTTNETFVSGFTYTPLGDVNSVSYPQCTFAACTGAGAAVPRTISFNYTNGFLTGVPGYANAITYNSNGLVGQVQHANGMTDTEARDPFAMRRPASITATGPTGWSSGTYSYDGAGNIKAIGTAAFTYDKVSRLMTSSQFDGATGGGNQKIQNYTFDPFGNLTSISGTSGRTTPTDPMTDRLNSPGVTYDAMGNLTAWNGAVYEYDGFSQMKHMVNGAQEWLYMYDADDERFWSFQVGGPARFDRFTLRDLSGKVLRTYEATAYNWTGSLAEDDIYRNGLLLAAETPAGTRHFHLDHLGTPRLITDAGGNFVAYHVYYPFGEEATTFNQDTERMKFTGHERDLASLAGAGDDLDYMHARFFSSVAGRFLSVDPVSGNPSQPQSWNRHTYALNNPINNTDPDGRCTIDGEKHGWLWCASHTLGLTQTQHEQVTIARTFFSQNDVVVNNQHVVASKLTDKQVMEAFASFNATWRNAGPSAGQLLTSVVTIPTIALSTLQAIDRTGAAPQGYKGGRQFQNDGRGGGQTLPNADANGSPITYREWDVNPSQPGVNRGGERLVTGSDGSAWFTSDHYQTLTRIR